MSFPECVSVLPFHVLHTETFFFFLLNFGKTTNIWLHFWYIQYFLFCFVLYLNIYTHTHKTEKYHSIVVLHTITFCVYVFGFILHSFTFNIPLLFASLLFFSFRLFPCSSFLCYIWTIVCVYYIPFNTVRCKYFICTRRKEFNYSENSWSERKRWERSKKKKKNITASKVLAQKIRLSIQMKYVDWSNQ